MIGQHVKAQDPEGRWARGWIIAEDGSGRVKVDLADDCGGRTGHLTGWLANPEACEPYVAATFRYFSVQAAGGWVDNRGYHPSGD